MFSMRLADHPFTVCNQYEYVRNLCRDYLCQEEGIPIRVTAEEIRRENTEGMPFRDDYLESLAVYRKICEALIDRDVVLFHCSSLMLDGKAYLFTAPSGTGKSTHARLWRQHFGSRAQVINDDKPLLKISGSEIRVYGTPYGGKDNLQNNISAPVAGILVLEQGKENRIRPMSSREAYPHLLNQTYRSVQPQKLLKTMDLVGKLAALPVYHLACTISDEAVVMAYHALKEGI